MSNSIKFPEGFLWGGATSAGQYEGGADEGGCGLSHMDYIRYLPRKEGMYHLVLNITPEMFEDYKAHDAAHDPEYYFRSAKVSISIIIIKRISHCSVRWASRPSA